MPPQLVAHLRENRARLREEWVARIRDTHLLEAMTQQAMATETTSVYDNYIFKPRSTGDPDGVSVPER